MDIKRKALFIYPALSSFIKKDIEILENQYQLITYELRIIKKWHTPFLMLHQFFFLLFHFNASVCIIEFAGFHSLIPTIFCKLFNIPTLIICGGNDCHSFPAIRYGNHHKFPLSFATQVSLNYCTHISTKDESLWVSEYNYDSRFPGLQGIKAFIPKIKTPNTTIHNGYDIEFWKKTESTRKSLSFITVSGNLNLGFQKELKGIDLIIEAAKQFPTFTFTIVGARTNHLLKDFPSNIHVLGNKNAAELRSLYSSHEYYLQLSIAEGFPNSLCEAMLCGCTPIVSNVFSMSKIVNDAGLIIQKRELQQLIDVFNEIEKNHKLNEDISRDNIAENYSIEKREVKLLKLVNDLSN